MTPSPVRQRSARLAPPPIDKDDFTLPRPSTAPRTPALGTRRSIRLLKIISENLLAISISSLYILASPLKSSKRTGPPLSRLEVEYRELSIPRSLIDVKIKILKTLIPIPSNLEKELFTIINNYIDYF